MQDVQTTREKQRTGDSAVRGYSRRKATVDSRLGDPCVWTDRMLTTLEQGVRGGKWHTLIDKVYAPLNLFAASSHVIGNQGAAGVDHQTVEGLQANRLKEVDKLHEALRTNTYRPQACGESGYRNREARSNDRYSDRAGPRGADRATASAGTDLRGHVSPVSYGFDTEGAVIMPWNGSKSCCEPDMCTWSMRTSKVILTRSRREG